MYLLVSFFHQFLVLVEHLSTDLMSCYLLYSIHNELDISPEHHCDSKHEKWVCCNHLAHFLN